MAQDLFVCGDFNMESSEWPLSEAAAVGLLQSADELVGFDGKQGVIDLGLVRGGIHPSARFTDAGVADHMLVAYVLLANLASTSLRWPKRRQLEIPTDPGAAGDRFDALWKKESVEFQAALRDHGLSRARRLLSRMWEAVIARTPEGGAERGRCAEPKKWSPASTRSDTSQSLLVRRLRRLERLWRHYQDHPTTSLHSSIHRHAHALRHHVNFPWGNWDVGSYSTALAAGSDVRVLRSVKSA